MATYLFYDVETTGLSAPFDQILEFAALRTDENFEVIEEHDIQVRLRPDVVPAPEALLTHRISVSDARAASHTEIEAVRTIHNLVNEPGTISLGYNTLGFDDDVLRFSFYRNLLDPYTHQWKDECQRMDLYPMTVLYWLLGSEMLDWPTLAGNTTLKLEHLGAANAFDDHPDHQSHTALSDVRETRRLAQALAEDGELWDEVTAHFERTMEEARINALPTFTIGDREVPIGLMVDGAFTAANNYQRPVIGLGTHRHYSNQTCWLALDTPSLPGVATRPIQPDTEVFFKKKAVPQFLVSWEDERINRLGDKRRAIVQKNLQWLRDHPSTFYEIAGYYRERTHPKLPHVDADAALYQADVFNDHEQAAFVRFHEASTIEEKLRVMRDMNERTFQTLALRIILRNEPEAAWPDIVRAYAQTYWRRINPRTRSDVLIDHQGNTRRTPADAKRTIETLRAEGFNGEPLDDEQHDLLDELEAYLETEFDAPRPASSMS